MTRIDQFIATGNLDAMSDQEKTNYYLRTCEVLGLNPATRPFDFIRLNGKLVLYAKRDCTDQLRKRDGISVVISRAEKVEDLYIVTARATNRDGRADESTGAVAIGGLKGEALANAIMKAETKAKRRATLSICGLGFSDESEIDSIPDVQRVEQPRLPAAAAPALVAAPATAAPISAPAPVVQPLSIGDRIDRAKEKIAALDSLAACDEFAKLMNAAPAEIRLAVSSEYLAQRSKFVPATEPAK